MAQLDIDLFLKLSSQTHSVDAPAYAVIERLASQFSAVVFSYDLAEESGLGKLTKAWTAANSVKYVSLQSRAGAGLTLVGRLSQGTSGEVRKNNVLTAYTTPLELAQMTCSLRFLPKATTFSRLVLQVATITSIGLELALSPTLAPLATSLYSLPDSFVVLLSSTPQESIELASASYHLPNNHVVHVFDYHSSARETSHLILSSQLSDDKKSIYEAMSELGYGFFDYAGDNEAHTILVLLNGPLAIAAKVLATQVPGLGVIVVRVLRPWDEEAFRAMLPTAVKHIHVIDEVPMQNVQGGLFGEVFATAFNPLSSEDLHIKSQKVLPETLKRFMAIPETFTSFVVTLLSDFESLPVPLPTLHSGAELKRLLFFSGTKMGISKLPSFITNTFLLHKGIRTRHLAAYDAFSKVGDVAADRIILSDKASIDDHIPIPFLLPLGSSVEEDSEGKADFIGILDQTLLKSHSVLKYARRGAPILITTSWTADETISNLSRPALDIIRERDLHLYILDTNGLATALSDFPKNSSEDFLENVIGHLAFLRLYLGKEDAIAQAVISRLAHSFFANTMGVVNAETVYGRTRDALESVLIPASRKETEADSKTPTLKKFEFNTIELDRCHEPVNINLSRVSPWHEAARHLIFREAFIPPPLTPATESDPYPQISDLRPDVPERTFLVTTAVNRRLTPKEYDRNVFHLEFDTKGTGLKYAVGEALGVHGWNDSDEILEFCQWYGVDPRQLITIPSPSRGDDKEKLVHTRTIFQALQQQIDIFGKPPKSFYGALSKHAKVREDQMALYFISSPEGSSTFKKLLEKDTVTFSDVLKAYPSARPPIEELCELIGDIAPRHYSIASSQAVVGDRVDLLIVTVDWVTPSGSPRYGQCTRYLAGLKIGQKVTVSIKPSVMKLPPDPMQPIIMAGLGTGAAPFRAFMQHRAWLANQKIPVGPLIYYFGSRHRSQEYLYGEEIEAYIADKIITHSGLAFSRDTKKKIYIQHKMREDAETLVRHLSVENGVFYLCGPTWPVPDVFEALVGALVKYQGKTAEEAGVYIENLKEEERYVLEVY